MAQRKGRGFVNHAFEDFVAGGPLMISKKRLLAVSAALMTSSVMADEDLAGVDKLAPMFRLPVYNAQIVGEPTLGLDKFVGTDRSDPKTKVLVVSFMASFCGPCKKEMPYLQMLSDKYKADGLRVLMVAIDKEEDGQKKVAELIEQNKVTFPVLKDRFNIVARRWLGSQSPLPSLFMVRPDGTVSSVHRGYREDGSVILAKEVEAALGKK